MTENTDRSDPGGRAGASPGRVGPNVRMPAKGAPLWLSISLILGAGVLLFAFLETSRKDHGTPAQTHPTVSTSDMLADPPPLAVPAPPPPPPPPPPQIQYVVQPAPAPPPEIRYIDRPAPSPPVAPAPASGSSGPALIVDLGAARETAEGPAGEDAAAHALVIRGRSTLVPQGTVIGAVLETPIDSTRIGPTRAIVTSDTRGFDGTRILIPKGSRLIGEIAGNAQPGQARVFVNWTRLIRPDGVAIRIASPASDSLGGVGIAGSVNNHTLERLTNAVLQSALIVGTELAARPDDGGVVVNTLPTQAASVGQVLIPNSDLTKPTIKVKAGARITVFVNHDLDFAGVQARR